VLVRLVGKGPRDCSRKQEKANESAKEYGRVENTGRHTNSARYQAGNVESRKWWGRNKEEHPKGPLR